MGGVLTTANMWCRGGGGGGDAAQLGFLGFDCDGMMKSHGSI
jgi:hypothetical protein